MQFRLIFVASLVTKHPSADAFVRHVNPIRNNVMSTKCRHSTTASFSSKQNDKSGINVASGEFSQNESSTHPVPAVGARTENVGSGGFFEVNQGDFDATKRSIELKEEKGLQDKSKLNGDDEVKNKVDLDHNKTDIISRDKIQGPTDEVLSPQTPKQPIDDEDRPKRKKRLSQNPTKTNTL